ncbi:MAG: hypothetical protein J7M38_01280 [Armatimonadetes bacterium]|nr:hypothetical protein [Armatimonadota bacterium]
MYCAGFDVHSKTSFCVILDEDGATVAKCKLDNDPFSFASFLLDFDEPMKAVLRCAEVVVVSVGRGPVPRRMSLSVPAVLLSLSRLSHLLTIHRGPRGVRASSIGFRCVGFFIWWGRYSGIGFRTFVHAQ